MTVSSLPPPKLRILVLHGFASNGDHMARRLATLQQACRDVADFECLTGPISVPPLMSRDEEEKTTGASRSVNERTRAWWKASDEGEYRGIEQTWKLIGEVISKGNRVDGVLGYSQGAPLAMLLTAAFEHPELVPQLNIPADHPPLKLCIAISGFRPRDPSLQHLFAQKLETPTLSILGREDQMVDADIAQTLIDLCKKHRTEWHDGGHVVPGQEPWGEFMRDWLISFQSGDNEEWTRVPGPEDRIRQAKQSKAPSHL